MKKILLLGTAREQSSRVTDKMIRPFAGTTLFDIYQYRFTELWESGWFHQRIMAIGSMDTVLRKDVCVPWLGTPNFSRGPKPRNVELDFLADFPECSHVFWFNACLPFFPIPMFIDAVHVLQRPKVKSVACKRVYRNLLWDAKGRVNPEVLKVKHMGTQALPVKWEQVHAFHGFDRAYLLETGTYYPHEPSDPEVLTLPMSESIAALDVDEEQDFKIAEAVWAAGYR